MRTQLGQRVHNHTQMLMVFLTMCTVLHRIDSQSPVPFPFVSLGTSVTLQNFSATLAWMPPNAPQAEPGGDSSSSSNSGALQGELTSSVFILMSAAECSLVGTGAAPLQALSRCTSSLPPGFYANDLTPNSVVRLGDGSLLVSADAATVCGGVGCTSSNTYVFGNIFADRSWSAAIVAGVPTQTPRAGGTLMRVRRRASSPTMRGAAASTVLLLGGTAPNVVESLSLDPATGMPSSWVPTTIDGSTLVGSMGSVAEVLYPVDMPPLALLFGTLSAGSPSVIVATMDAYSGNIVSFQTYPNLLITTTSINAVGRRESYVFFYTPNLLQLVVVQLGGASGSTPLGGSCTLSGTISDSPANQACAADPRFFSAMVIEPSTGEMLVTCSTPGVYATSTTNAVVTHVAVVGTRRPSRSMSTVFRVQVRYESMPPTALVAFSFDDDCVNFVPGVAAQSVSGSGVAIAEIPTHAVSGTSIFACFNLGFCPDEVCSGAAAVVTSNVSMCVANGLCIYGQFNQATCCPRQSFPGFSSIPTGSVWGLARAARVFFPTLSQEISRSNETFSSTASRTATLTVDMTVSTSRPSPSPSLTVASRTVTISNSSSPPSHSLSHTRRTASCSATHTRTGSSTASKSSSGTATVTVTETGSLSKSTNLSTSLPTPTASSTSSTTRTRWSPTATASISKATLTDSRRTRSRKTKSKSKGSSSASSTMTPYESPGAPSPSVWTYVMFVGGAVAVLVAAIALGVAVYRRRQRLKAARSALASQPLINHQSDASTVVGAGGAISDDERMQTRDLPSTNSGPLAPQYQTLVNTRKYSITKLLGRGGYGMVFLAVRNSDKSHAALKYITCRTDYDRQVAMREFEVIMRVKHPNMIAIWDFLMNWQQVVDITTFGAANKSKGRGGRKGGTNGREAPNKSSAEGGPEEVDAALAFHGAASPFQVGDDVNTALVRPRYVAMVTPFYKEGDLKRYCYMAKREGNQLSEPHIVCLFAQIATVIVKLHDEVQQIVHRDLKPENILLDHNAAKAVVTDFGLAFNNVNEASHMTTQAGSLPFVAPECWTKHYNYKVDIWGLGCMLYAVCTQRVTGEDSRVMFNDVDEPGFEETIEREVVTDGGYSNELFRLMMRMLQKSPLHRPSAHEVEVELLAILQRRPYPAGMQFIVPTPLPRPEHALQRELREHQLREEEEARARREAQERRAAREARKLERARAATAAATATPLATPPS